MVRSVDGACIVPLWMAAIVVASCHGSRNHTPIACTLARRLSLGRRATSEAGYASVPAPVDGSYSILSLYPSPPPSAPRTTPPSPTVGGYITCGWQLAVVAGVTVVAGVAVAAMWLLYAAAAALLLLVRACVHGSIRIWVMCAGSKTSHDVLTATATPVQRQPQFTNKCRKHPIPCCHHSAP